MTITPMGDQALLLMVATEVGEAALARVQHVARVLAGQVPGVREVVPAFTTVAVMLTDSATLSLVEARIRSLLKAMPVRLPPVEGREREIPVCYEDDFAPDLARVAEFAGLRTDEVISVHSGAEYRVHAIGFAPGFPYLAGLSQRLHVPRRPTPRTRVPAGSVGIGGSQTGIYPLATPGGWQIIGRTPHPLFEPRAEPPAWLQPGDRVRFRPISREEFDSLRPAMEAARQAALSKPQGAGTAPVMVVERPGIHTTVQDTGRPGWQAQGVPVGGALDPRALRVANLLVGNESAAAGLEWLIDGPLLRFEAPRVVAVTGVEPERFTAGRPRLVQAGEKLDLTASCAGTRGYLAVAGGIDVPVVLGSRSTALRAGFGGFAGRTLRRGDRLGTMPPQNRNVPSGWCVGRSWIRPDKTSPVRIVPGPHASVFAAGSWSDLTESAFRVRLDSDRMGLRLTGRKITRARTGEIVSIPVAAGAIQVPPDGQPIVLLADRQTLGGYPQVAYVISADLPRLAHARPGAEIWFREVTLSEAERVRLAAEHEFNLLALGVEQKLSGGSA